MKYLLFIGIALILLWLLRRPATGRSKSRHGTSAHRTERMVKCARCGVFFPEGEAIVEGSTFYCCAEHRQRNGQGSEH